MEKQEMIFRFLLNPGRDDDVVNKIGFKDLIAYNLLISLIYFLLSFIMLSFISVSYRKPAPLLLAALIGIVLKYPVQFTFYSLALWLSLITVDCRIRFTLTYKIILISFFPLTVKYIFLAVNDYCVAGLHRDYGLIFQTLGDTIATGNIFVDAVLDRTDIFILCSAFYLSFLVHPLLGNSNWKSGFVILMTVTFPLIILQLIPRIFLRVMSSL